MPFDSYVRRHGRAPAEVVCRITQLDDVGRGRPRLNNKTSNTVVAIRNDFSQARCTNRYIAVDNVDDDENVCDSQRVRLRRGLLLPAFIE